MPLARLLRDEAEVLAGSLRYELAKLAIEKRRLERPSSEEDTDQRRHVLIAIDRAVQGIARLEEFNPESQRPYDCPYCWIIEGRRFQLKPAQGRIEAAACPNCTAEYALDR